MESQIPSQLLLLIITLISIVAGFLYFKFKSLEGKNLPPGSFGFPLIGETISLVKACKHDKINEWMQEHTKKYGPVFKTSILGSKVVVLTGQAGSKFVFQGGDNGISLQQPKTIVKILGKNSVFELSGARHKLVRGAIVGFFRPENIQNLVSQMDYLVQDQLLKELEGKDSIKMVDLMKKVAFNVAWSIFFGLPEENEKESLLEDFKIAVKGVLAAPLNFPGTALNKALKAKGRLHKRLSQLVEIKKRELKEEEEEDSFLWRLINLRDENGEPLAEEAILDIFFSMMSASHDTTASLMNLLVRQISRDYEVYNKVLEEQKEVEKKKGENENGRVSYREIQMMKYTWKVAQELMRINPPLPGNFRQTTRDINFQGFDIPKGWQLHLALCGTHMDKNIFEDPSKFDPSRFENSWKNYPPYTYVAFGAGPRICPGVEFARIETMLVIHHLVTKFQWKQMLPDEPLTCNPIPYPAMGLPVTFINP